jgi:hypothetical protein
VDPSYPKIPYQPIAHQSEKQLITQRNLQRNLQRNPHSLKT